MSIYMYIHINVYIYVYIIVYTLEVYKTLIFVYSELCHS